MGCQFKVLRLVIAHTHKFWNVLKCFNSGLGKKLDKEFLQIGEKKILPTYILPVIEQEAKTFSTVKMKTLKKITLYWKDRLNLCQIRKQSKRMQIKKWERKMLQRPDS